jgi:hypothetical protein
MSNPNPFLELIGYLAASSEHNATFDTTGRHRGHWTEIVETVPGAPEAYVYWAALDPHQPSGYKVIEHPDPEADFLDLELKRLTDGDDGGTV